MTREETQALATTVEGDAKTIQAVVDTLVVKDETGLNKAAEILSNVKTRIKRLEDKRKEYVGPINDQVKAINEDFKRMAAPYLEAERLVKSAIGSYMDAQRKIQEDAEREERKRRQEEARVLAEAEGISTQKAAAEVRKAAEAEAVAKPVEEKPATAVAKKMATKIVTRFEVVDPSKVPAEYLVVDHSAIRQAVAAGAKRIAGVKIWEESQIVGYTK